jgi:hypothetical protein
MFYFWQTWCYVKQSLAIRGLISENANNVNTAASDAG